MSGGYVMFFYALNENLCEYAKNYISENGYIRHYKSGQFSLNNALQIGFDANIVLKLSYFEA